MKNKKQLSKVFKPNIFKLNIIKFSILFFLLITIIVQSSNLVLAQNDHLTLLAVSHLSNGSMQGTTADIYLQLQKGSGRIFMDTYPVSKFDTQLSTRYARDVACKFANVDCTKYDFLYTIRAESNIIGGPSASAGISALTYAKLLNLEVDDSVAVTGTINSGRLVGNVGGIKEKIQGAAELGLSKVLIPISEVKMQLDINLNTTLNNKTQEKTINNIEKIIINNSNESNNSKTLITEDKFDMIAYGNNLGIEVVGVSDLEEVLYHLTGAKFNNNIEFNLDKNYEIIMKNISASLCKRSNELVSEISKYKINKIANKTITVNTVNELYNMSLDQINKSKLAKEINAYYSSASYCYSANVNLQTILQFIQNNTNKEYLSRVDNIQKALKLLKGNINNKTPETIPELQTIIILKQRIDEAQNYLDEAYKYDFRNKTKIINTSKINKKEEIISNDTFSKNRIITSLSWATERLFTTSEWANFLDLEGAKININQNILRESCKNIKQETSMRIQYAELFLPILGLKSKELDELNVADPILCIAKSTLIKADVNALISTIGMDEEMLKELVKRKLSKATEVLSEETNAGRFPILGYSYYEYGKNLVLTSPSSALLYSEYALELSNLDIYLNTDYASRKGSDSRTMLNITSRELFILFFALFFGYIFGIKSTYRFFKGKRESNDKSNKLNKKKDIKIKKNNLKN